MRHAFSRDHGALTDMETEPGEGVAMMDLLAGANGTELELRKSFLKAADVFRPPGDRDKIRALAIPANPPR